mgnify:CR=1 FL=1
MSYRDFYQFLLDNMPDAVAVEIGMFTPGYEIRGRWERRGDTFYWAGGYNGHIKLVTEAEFFQWIGLPEIEEAWRSGVCSMDNKMYVVWIDVHVPNPIEHETLFGIDIHIDGGAKGNPGPAAAAAVLSWRNSTLLPYVKKFGWYLGHDTNNHAELMALLLALKQIKHPHRSRVLVYSDSNWLVGRFSRNEKVKVYKKETEQIFQLISKCYSFSIQYIPREQNKEADKIVKLVQRTRKNFKK